MTSIQIYIRVPGNNHILTSEPATVIIAIDRRRIVAANYTHRYIVNGICRPPVGCPRIS